MSTDHLVLCGGARLSSRERRWRDAKRCSLVCGKGPRDVHLNLSHLTKRLASGLPDVAVDLLEIASYFYVADQAIRRGGTKEFEYGDRWVRNVRFEIPVRCLDVWRDPRIGQQLAAMLGYLTDDSYEFGFTKHVNPPPIDAYLYDEFASDDSTDIEEVIWFSGGADSLGGAVREIVVGQRRVALVSHRSSSKIYNRQASLYGAILNQVARPTIRPRFVAVEVNKGKPLGVQFTQRSRSFLFATIGAVVARVFGLNRLRFYENGVTSFNLPLADHILGGRASRTTHPRVLADFQELFSRLFERPFAVENPFLWNTKTEVIESIKAAGQAKLCAMTVSCGHTWTRTTEHPHCGVCTQCIDRRLSAMAAKLGSNEDDPNGYECDLLTDERNGPDLMLMERFVGTVRQIDQMSSAVEFVAKYPELVRAIPYTGLSRAEALERSFQLHKRHSQSVLAVLSAEVDKDRLVRGKYPAASLLGIICRQGRESITSAKSSSEGEELITPTAATKDTPKIRVVADELSVYFGGKPCFFGSSAEFRVIQVLVKRIGKYASYDVLRDEAWAGERVQSNTIQRTVSNVRRILEDNKITGWAIDGSEKDHYKFSV